MSPPSELLARIRSAEGFAVPVALVVLFIALLLLIVAATQARTATGVSGRSTNARRALQAADAGLEVGRYRMNTVSTASLLTVTLPCAVKVAGVSAGVEVGRVAVGANGWCPAVDEPIPGGGTATYEVSNFLDACLLGLVCTPRRRIVSTGTFSGVTRRLMAEFTGPSSLVALITGILVAKPIFTQVRWVECTNTPPTPSVPDSGC